MEAIHGKIDVVDASESSTRYATTAEVDGSIDDGHEASADADVNDADSRVEGIGFIVEEVGDVLNTAFAELPEPRPDTTHVDEALTNVLQNCEGMRKF